MDTQLRAQRLATELEQRDLTHFVAAPGATFRYLTGAAAHLSERLTLCGVGRDGALALLAPELELSGLPADGMWRVAAYTDEAGPGQAVEEFARLLGLSGASAVGYEEMALRQFEYRMLSSIGCGMKAVDGLVSGMRAFKEPDEIELLRTAARVVDAALDRTVPLLKAGMSELEIAAELEYRLRQAGSEGLPFPTIVGSGSRGALPHGSPSARKTLPGDLVVLDFGATVEGYVADITRTLAFADPDARAVRAYNVVRQAQAAGVAACRPGVTLDRIDRTVRGVIEQAGLGRYFIHRTGHGLGLEAHEPPSVVQGNEMRLREGMVFTIEPGVYLPEEFGIRIEDDVAVTEDGVLVLTAFPRELIVL